jgi:hypothetical protein
LLEIDGRELDELGDRYELEDRVTEPLLLLLLLRGAEAPACDDPCDDELGPDEPVRGTNFPPCAFLKSAAALCQRLSRPSGSSRRFDPADDATTLPSLSPPARQARSSSRSLAFPWLER